MGCSKPVVFPPDLVRVLPRDLHGACCCTCDKPQARWALARSPRFAPVCGPCILYELPWEGKDPEDLARFAGVLGLLPAGGGRVCSAGADRIVGGLLMAAKAVAFLAEGAGYA